MKLAQCLHGAGMGILGCLFSLDVGAHALWLENDAGATRLYFGEYAENQRETSPGRLDSIIEPMVTVVSAKGAEQPVDVRRENDNFVIPVSTEAEGGAVLVQALKQSIREPQGKIPSPTYRRFLYARIGSGGSLPLDIEESANVLRLIYQGNPVPKAEIVVIAPNGWEKHLQTDEKGETVYSLLDPGLYVIEAKYEIHKPGEFEGKAYAVESHKVTRSLYK